MTHFTKSDLLASDDAERNNTCPFCGVALADHPRVAELCQRVQELGDERDRLKAAIAKMSHRKCHDCGHVAYYLDCTIPECNCEKCGSSDTRRVKEATDG